MHTKVSSRSAAGLPRFIAALTLCAASAASWALPMFTLLPNNAVPSLNGGAVTADNIIVSDFSHVTVDAITGDFTDTGMLSVQSFQLAGAVAASTGLNTTYGLYITFSGTGTQTPGNLLTDFTHGTFTTLDYTLWGFNGGPATFGFDGANNVTTTAVGAFALATGSLVSGTVGTAPADNNGTASFVPSANATLKFVTMPGQLAFFDDPVPFYNLAFAAFTNTVSQVEVISPYEFRIRQGGGAFNFATAIPEPESYALMLAGLGAIAFVALRRKV